MVDEISSVLERAEKDEVKFVQLHFTDIFGMVKSVTIPSKHLETSLESGTWFDGSSIEGFTRIAESDMYLMPDASTYSVIPWLESSDGNTARFICDVHNPDGRPFEGDPRHILRNAIKEAKDLGYVFNTGPELEFFLFEKQNGEIKALPHDTGGYFDLTTDKAYEVRREMHVALEKMGINVETSHHEVALGQHEFSFHYENALKSADYAITLKFVLKAIAQKHGLHATFMPKPIATQNGSGMHVHQSLFNEKKDENAFYDASDKYNLSSTAHHFIAGLLTHARGMSSVLSPTVNSYKRLVPGYEAPVYICWANINRSALIRVPRISKGKVKSTRIEYRSPDPSCNIYLAFAVMLKAGLDGVKNKLTAPKPVEENIYKLSENKLSELKIDTLPHSLWQALLELKNDKVIQEALGKHTYERYIEAKTNEWDEFRVNVTNWELEKYLERY